MTETIQAFKGFNPDLTCLGFQYVEGETYEHDGPVKVCSSGFHAVTQPIHVLRYYPPNKSVYHIVELGDVSTDNTGEDSKVAGRSIKVGARIELPALIKAQVDFVFKNSKKVAGASSKNDHAQVGTDVENGAATASGDYGAATASGRSGAATASGDYGAATASGDSGAATASGRSGAATASGYSGAATASGYKSVALASGYAGRARGKVGTALFLTERDTGNNIIAAIGVLVDGETVKADTFYRLVGGVLEAVGS